jgi:threonine dehydratase
MPEEPITAIVVNSGYEIRMTNRQSPIQSWSDRIRQAYDRIKQMIRETPCERSHALLPDHSGQIFLKCEHLQHTGSFKFRGASNKVALLTKDQAQAGVIAASNGNHGLGVAAAAKARNVDAEIFVSSQVSPAKAQAIRAEGARIRSIGNDPLEAELAARRWARECGKVFISPYNDSDVIAGQGTIGVELVRQIPKIDAVFVAVGGGGLIGGIGAHLKSVLPQVEIVGCWPENSPVLYECMKAGHVIEVPERPTLSESTAGGLEPDSVTLDLCRAVVDRSVLVSEAEILSAMRYILETEHWLIEGAAGVAVAAFMKEAQRYPGKTVVMILCGRNASPEVLRKLL